MNPVVMPMSKCYPVGSSFTGGDGLLCIHQRFIFNFLLVIVVL